MGVPFSIGTFCSLLAVEEFVDDNPDVMNAQITITGVHVRDLFDLVRLLTGKEDESGWTVKHLDSIRGDGRKFALFVEDFESLVDEAIESIDDNEAITVNLGESLKEEAVRFLNLVKGNNSFSFFIGFAQYTVHVGDDAIEASAIPDGEEESGTDGEEESGTDGEDDFDGEVDAGEDVPADGDGGEDEGADQAVQDQPTRLVRLRHKLEQVKAALKQLAAVCLVFPPPKENPVHYTELADFVHRFPVEPELLPVIPPALLAEAVVAQPDANGAHAAPEE